MPPHVSFLCHCSTGRYDFPLLFSSGPTLALALQDYKPFAGVHGDTSSESKLVVWVRKLADLARSKDRDTRLQAAHMMKETFGTCDNAVLPKVQVSAVGVLLALVRQVDTAWACSAVALGALSELEQGLWRLGADAGGHREAAQLLARYLPEGFKAVAAIARIKEGTGESWGREETAVVEAVLVAVERTISIQPTSLRPLYHQIVKLAAQYLGHKAASTRQQCARVLAMTPSALPRDLEAASSVPAWQRLNDDVCLAAAHLLWHVDGLTPDGTQGPEPSQDSLPEYLRHVGRLPDGEILFESAHAHPLRRAQCMQQAAVRCLAAARTR